jgi:hypothetical protein
MNRLTVMITTHYEDGLSYRRLIGTLNSFKLKCSVDYYPTYIIGYDKHNEDNSYLEKLLKIKEATVVYGDYLGIGGSLSLLEKNINSKYIFNLEHDWSIEKHINLNKIMDIMDKYNYVNYIRFNKRNNIIFDPFDSVLEKEDKITEIPLLKTWSYSGNPHIVRTEFFKKIVVPQIRDSIWKGHHKRAMEAPMTELIKSYPEDFYKYGTYIYGDFNDEAIVRHIE